MRKGEGGGKGIRGMSPGLPMEPFLWLAGALLLVSGGLLMLRGFWPPRQGHAPYCAKCGYSLIGLDSPRCPECGTAISPKTTVRGERHARPIVGAAGVVLVLGWLVLFGIQAHSELKQVKLYHYVPASWVLGDLQSPNQAEATKAWDELARRWWTDGLNASQKARLIDLCLAEQVASCRLGLTPRLVRHLQECYEDGVLTESQRDKFLSQIAQVEFTVRPRAAYGAEVPYVFHYEGGGPWRRPQEPAFWVRLQVEDLVLDGKPGAPAPFGWPVNVRGSMLDAFHTCGGVSASALGPGRHELKLPLKVSVFFGPLLDEEASRRCHHEDRLLTATFEVLRPGAGDGITLIQDPSLKGELLKCFQHLELHVKGPDTSKPSNCTLRMAFDPFPVGVAFNVYVRVKDKERRFGFLARPQKPEEGNYGMGSALDPPVPETVDVIFRSSKAVARETTDVFEMWDGELVFENVPVKTD